jgi:CheY-like chemotaxis protein
MDELTLGEQIMDQGNRVMIIEDDPDMIELLSLILKRGGYEPVSALGGKEGLRQLPQVDPDLILLDLMMEDMSGWSVLETIKADERYRAIPVIIVSARHHLEDPVQTTAHADQYEGYLVKPFIVRDLLGQIEEAMR